MALIALRFRRRVRVRFVCHCLGLNRFSYTEGSSYNSKQWLGGPACVTLPSACSGANRVPLLGIECVLLYGRIVLQSQAVLSGGPTRLLPSYPNDSPEWEDRLILPRTLLGVVVGPVPMARPYNSCECPFSRSCRNPLAGNALVVIVA